MTGFKMMKLRVLKFYTLVFVGVLFVVLVSRKLLYGNLTMSREESLLEGVKKWYNYSKDDLNGEGVLMDDPRLVAKLRSHFLIGPPTPGSTHQGYNLAEPDVEDTSMGQAKKIRSILNDKRNGTFIECGALDGEIRSNTLYFERYLDWNGLLIEADPLNFAQMMEKNRKAWLSPTCLSIKSYPEIVSFEQNQNMGKISDNAAGIQIPGHVDVQCFPLYTYMLALNLTHVDYFSLDVEGNELDVLETIPFDKVNIETLSVEFVHVARGQDALKDFMSSKGYKIHSKVTHPNWLANDFIFVKA